MQVIGLVGPSGTGKSHRASMVAQKFGISHIIDDGLLIRQDRILAGRSAKREATGLAAVRRAVFSCPGHAREVAGCIQREAPDRLLILCTSQNMGRRITEALGLPAPSAFLDISQVATPEEIDAAREIRRQQGKHVIPAPTFEVKKSFSGYLIDPLRIFYRGESERRAVLIEKSVVRPTYSTLGRFYISEQVVSQLARHVAGRNPAVASVMVPRVTPGEEGVILTLKVAVLIVPSLHEHLREAQAQIKAAVEYMTALNVLAVNINAVRAVQPAVEA